MIFVTVGTQLPFDRLLNAVDDWARANPSQEIVAQTGVSNVTSPRVEALPFVDTARFRALVERADVLVAHAGMGSILTAIELGKPVVVMPRRAALGEHRNDHQLATAEKLGHLSNLHRADDAATLARVLDALLGADTRARREIRRSPGHAALLENIGAFIGNGTLPALHGAMQ